MTPRTMTIRQYARAHSLPVTPLVAFLGYDEDGRERQVDEDTPFDYTVIADAHDSIDQAAVAELVEARDDLDDARQEVKRCEEGLRDAVREALEDLPATRVAEVLGVSRARVYQIRDAAR